MLIEKKVKVKRGWQEPPLLWTGDMTHIPTRRGQPVVLPENVCLLMSGKEAKTTDAWGFPPAPQTLTSLSPKCKHESKCLDQNKQAARAERILMLPWCHTKHWLKQRKKTKTKKVLKVLKADRECLSGGGKWDSVKFLDTTMMPESQQLHTVKGSVTETLTNWTDRETVQSIWLACAEPGEVGGDLWSHMNTPAVMTQGCHFYKMYLSTASYNALYRGRKGESCWRWIVTVTMLHLNWHRWKIVTTTAKNHFGEVVTPSWQ